MSIEEMPQSFNSTIRQKFVSDAPLPEQLVLAFSCGS